MKIKKGDKVRVSSRVPRIYERFGSMIAPHYECKVVEIDDGMALLDSIPAKYIFLFPLKYLVKVDAEAEKPKFKVGDKVVRKNVSTVRTIISIDYVDDDEAPAYHYNTVDSQGNNPMDFLESELILYTESTPKYKKGDRVKICSKNAERFGRVGTILEVHDNGTVVVDFNDYYVGGHLYSVDFIEPYTEPTEDEIIRQREAEFDEFVKEGIDRVHHPEKYATYEVTIDNVAVDWTAYTADLAKEIALKVANRYNDPEEVAEYAVKFANAVVEGLKRK